MPGAKQVNKTTMMIVHANVVAVFFTFGSSAYFRFTLAFHEATCDGQIGGYFTDCLSLIFKANDCI